MLFYVLLIYSPLKNCRGALAGFEGPQLMVYDREKRFFLLIAVHFLKP